MATIRDVAKKAGVSIATVSRVMNNKGKIKPETEETVRAAMEALAYTPNKVAQGLSNQRSHAIAFILPSIRNPYFPEMARAVEDVANEHGYHVFICNTDDDRDKLVSYLNNLVTYYVDGIILNSHIINQTDLEKLEQNNVSVVMMDRVLEQANLTSFLVKNRQGARMATQHLIDIGCKHIGHISGDENIQNAKNRKWGYLDVAHSITNFKQSWIAPGEFTVEGGYQAAKELFMRHPEIDGIFASNDMMAIGVLRAAYEWGKSVPNDLAIIGFDGIDMSALTVPPISTIQQPTYQLGALAMETLLRHIEEKSTEPKTYELDVELIVRETTMKTISPSENQG